jgi:small subunit ribosomal protein S6
LRRYETVIIVPADLSDDDIITLIDRYKAIVSNHKGLVVKVEKWGKRKLAYEIRKHNKGFYMLIDFAGQSAVVAELERNLKIDDKILKFMTVLKAETVDIEALEKEIAEATGPVEKKEPPPAAGAAETVAPGTADAQPAVPKEITVKGEKDS